MLKKPAVQTTCYYTLSSQLHLYPDLNLTWSWRMWSQTTSASRSMTREQKWQYHRLHHRRRHTESRKSESRWSPVQSRSAPLPAWSQHRQRIPQNHLKKMLRPRRAAGHPSFRASGRRQRMGHWPPWRNGNIDGKEEGGLDWTHQAINASNVK